MALVLAWGSTLGSQACRAQCSSFDITAVVLFDGVDPDSQLQLQLLHITPVLGITNPSDEEMLAAVDSVFGGEPLFSHGRIATANNFHLYWASPLDFGAASIVDWRTGDVVFAGTITWLGSGSLVIPTTATHTLSPSPGLPAAMPAEIATFPSPLWDDPAWDTPEQITQDAVELLRQTDLFRSFAECGDYKVVGFTYTPAVGATDPRAAGQVMIVSGRATPPWATVAVEQGTWSIAKGLYR